ncbi:MAG: sigma-54-dependent transcriptional regulator [Planctomycetota bacterium]
MSDGWKPRILVADDEEIQRNILGEILFSAGYLVVTAGGVGEAVRLFRAALEEENPCDLVLTDLKMPADTEGLELLKEVKEIRPEAEVILMTAYSTVRSAVTAMKLGAFEYLPKPFDKERLLHVVSQVTEKLALRQENLRLRRLVAGGTGLGRIIGRSEPMQELYRIIERVAATPSICMIRGESGTGKELVARAIHSNGPRADQPFIAINCAAIPETLIESELFGHDKGVFTGAVTARAGRFEEVGEGTLFLDEIGSMKFDLQAKLLRVIQEREFSRVGSSRLVPFHGRILAATAQDLEAAIAEHRFREDLYFRLNVVSIEIPPLRERASDIPLLVEHFLLKGSERIARPVRGVTAGVLAAFEDYSWPGNVRELENCLERMLVLGDDELLGKDLLPPALLREGGMPPHLGELEGGRSNGSGGAAFFLPEDGLVLEEMEADLIRQALERSDGKLEPAARLLGITYKTLQYRIKKHRLKECPEGEERGAAS